MIIDSPIVSGSQLASGPFTQIGNVQITGSLSVTGTINGSITGSITSASYATNAETASYSPNYVDLTNNQTVDGQKSFTSGIAAAGGISFPATPGGSNYGAVVGNSFYFQIAAQNGATILVKASDGTNGLAIDGVGNSTMTSVTANSFTGSLLGNASTATTASYAVNANSISSSFVAYSASVSTRLTVDETNVTNLSSSFVTTSGSLSTRVTNVEATASTNTQASASFATMSGSLSIRVTNLESTSSTLTSASASFATMSGSLSTRVTNLESTSSTISSSFVTTSGSIAGRVTTIESKYATTGSNNFTGVQYVSNTSNAVGFTSTASLYTEGGLRVKGNSYISGTAYFNDVVVYGTSSIQYITSSQLAIGTNIITLNTDTPSVRFGGISVFDSGSNNLSTGSLFWDSEKDKWIYSNPSASTYDGGMLISGPRNSSGLGNEVGTTSCALMMGQGGDHITSSAIFSYGNATCFYGTAFTVSGSGNIAIGSAPTSASLFIKSTGANGIFMACDINNQDVSSRILFESCRNQFAIFNSGGRLFFNYGSTLVATSGTNGFYMAADGTVNFVCDVTAKTLGTNDLILNNLNHEHANYVDGTRGSWLIQEGACDLFIINQVSCKKYKFNLIEIK